MTEAEMMQDLASADAAGDSALAAHIAGQIKATRQPGPVRKALNWMSTPFESAKPMLEANRQTMNAAGGGILGKDSGDAMAGAARFIGSIPGADQYAVSDEHAQRLAKFDKDYPILGHALPLAAGFARPVPTTAPYAREPDQVAAQINRVRTATQSGAPAAPTVLTKTLEFLVPHKLQMAYKLLKGPLSKLTGAAESAGAGTAYPAGEAFTPVQRAVAQVPEAAQDANPALSAAADRSRSAILDRMRAAEDTPPRPPEEQFTPVPRRPPQSAPPPAVVDPQLASVAQARRATILENARQMEAPAAAAQPAPVSVLPSSVAAATGNPFESAARAAKVSSLAKTVEANAVAHLGADTMSPQFADAIAGMPKEWWEGMAKVAKVNAPSEATVNEITQFFRDRAAQHGAATIKRAAGQ